MCFVNLLSCCPFHNPTNITSTWGVGWLYTLHVLTPIPPQHTHTHTHTHTVICPFPPLPSAGNSFPEAEVEEVLDSLRLRIRYMFKWAKFEVMGFEDLSPLDQKALLRRTVAELVMLGFARGSIPYDGESGALFVRFAWLCIYVGCFAWLCIYVGCMSVHSKVQMKWKQSQQQQDFGWCNQFKACKRMMLNGSGCRSFI